MCIMFQELNNVMLIYCQVTLSLFKFLYNYINNCIMYNIYNIYNKKFCNFNKLKNKNNKNNLN